MSVFSNSVVCGSAGIWIRVLKFASLWILIQTLSRRYQYYYHFWLNGITIFIIITVVLWKTSLKKLHQNSDRSRTLWIQRGIFWIRFRIHLCCAQVPDTTPSQWTFGRWAAYSGSYSADAFSFRWIQCLFGFYFYVILCACIYGVYFKWIGTGIELLFFSKINSHKNLAHFLTICCLSLRPFAVLVSDYLLS